MTRILTSRIFGVNLLLALVAILAVAGSGCGLPGASANTSGLGTPTSDPNAVKVDVVYLNHFPVLPVLSDVDKVLAKYGPRLVVNRFDFDTPEGEAFAKAEKLTEHVPLAIFINGSMEFKVGGRQVKFYSFPQGQGTFMVSDGDWSMTDLDAVLAQVTGVKP